MSDEFMKYVNERRDGWLTQDRKELFNIAQALREGKSDTEIIELYNVTMEQINSTRKIMGI